MFEFIDESGERITVRSRRTLANLLCDGRIDGATLFRSEGQSEFSPARTHAELCSLADERGVPFPPAESLVFTPELVTPEKTTGDDMPSAEIAVGDIAPQEIVAPTLASAERLPRVPVQPIVPNSTPRFARIPNSAPAMAPPPGAILGARYRPPPVRPFRDGMVGLQAMLRRFFLLSVGGVLTWQAVILQTSQQPKAALATLVVCAGTAFYAGRYRTASIWLASRSVRVLSSLVFVGAGLGVCGWGGCAISLITAIVHELSVPRWHKLSRG